MKKHLSQSEQLNEKWLFHGTKQQHIEAICQQGFDWRVSGASFGALFGKGIYFARDSLLSLQFTCGSHTMFLARVLVGDFCVGEKSYVRPPEKSKGILYDSCVDDLENPGRFVIFETSQAYPEYLIEYEKCK